MKKFFVLAAFSLCLVAFSNAQRYAVIDTKYILDKMPEYKTAQKQLDDVAAGWQKEVDALQQELDKMYKDFEAEQVM
ncbi:MAG TPA: OmpH family outer membrane protein, partial [Flavisolibacter sp.]|nr:OmpH family outer membrane protein [Flavisolibacter sp.]